VVTEGLAVGEGDVVGKAVARFHAGGPARPLEVGRALGGAAEGVLGDRDRDVGRLAAGRVGVGGLADGGFEGGGAVQVEGAAHAVLRGRFGGEGEGAGLDEDAEGEQGDEHPARVGGEPVALGPRHLASARNTGSGKSSRWSPEVLSRTASTL